MEDVNKMFSTRFNISNAKNYRWKQTILYILNNIFTGIIMPRTLCPIFPWISLINPKSVIDYWYDESQSL